MSFDFLKCAVYLVNRVVELLIQVVVIEAFAIFGIVVGSFEFCPACGKVGYAGGVCVDSEDCLGVWLDFP